MFKIPKEADIAAAIEAYKKLETDNSKVIICSCRHHCYDREDLGVNIRLRRV
jgi:hypothetical protein